MSCYFKSRYYLPRFNIISCNTVLKNNLKKLNRVLHALQRFPSTLIQSITQKLIQIAQSIKYKQYGYVHDKVIEQIRNEIILVDQIQFCHISRISVLILVS